MKLILALLAIATVSLTACSSSNDGPVTRAGATAGNAVDTAVYNTGTAVKRTGQTIQNVVD